jgi:hypothetical protein
VVPKVVGSNPIIHPDLKVPKKTSGLFLIFEVLIVLDDTNLRCAIILKYFMLLLQGAFISEF